MAADRLPAAEDACERIAQCVLAVSPAPWPFAQARKTEIEDFWLHCQKTRPKLFNGTIFVLRDWRISAGTFTGSFLRTDFKSFLYWKEGGCPEAGVRDGFGSAVIRSAEGHLIFGRQTGGNINAGLVYPPGGFIDARDVRGATIDIDASIARELTEETGLRPGELERTPGYWLTRAGPLVSIGIEWRSALAAEDLRQRILGHVRSQAEPELADVVIVRGRETIGAADMPSHARAIVGRLFAA